MPRVAGSARCSFRHLQNDHRLVSKENQWREKSVLHAKCKQHVENLLATIMNMVFGAENLKSNVIKLVFISLLRSESDLIRDSTQKDIAKVCETNFACQIQK